MQGHPFYIIEETPKGLSVSDVAKSLSLSESTIYRYLEEGKLKKIETFTPQIAISEESVAALQEEINEVPSDSISLFKLTKELNISRKRVFTMLEKLNITLPIVKRGLREQYAVTPEIKARLLKELHAADILPKSTFYHKKYDIAVFQSLYSSLEQRYYRVHIQSDGRWVILTADGAMSYEDARLKLNLVPHYSIHGEKRTHPLTIRLQITQANPTFYQTIDAIYSTFHMENLQLKVENELFIFYVTVGEYTVQPQHYSFITACVTEGEIGLISEQVLRANSTDVMVSITYTKAEYEALQALAAAQDLSIQELIRKLTQTVI